VPGCGVRSIFFDCIFSPIRFLCVLAPLLWMPGLEAQALGPASGPHSDDFQRTVRQAGVIFVGTVTAVHCEFGKDKLPRTYQVSFQVKQGMRGIRTGSPLVIREWAGLWEAGRTPRYRVGERALLFLYPPSRAGLTSTVGGKKGKLTVVADAIHGTQVSLPLGWLDSVGQPPVANLPAGSSKNSSPTASLPQPTQVPVAWLIQRIAQAGHAANRGE